MAPFEVVQLCGVNFLGAETDDAGAGAELGRVGGGHDGDGQAERLGEFAELVDERSMRPSKSREPVAQFELCQSLSCSTAPHKIHFAKPHLCTAK